MSTKITVVAAAPGACLSSGRTLFPGEVAETTLDETLESLIRSGIVNVVEIAEPVAPRPRKPSAPVSAAAASTEGE